MVKRLKAGGSLEHLLEEKRRILPKEHFAKQAHLDSIERYRSMYQQSLRDPDRFWLEQAGSLHWQKRPDLGCRYVWDGEKEEVWHTWFEDGELNACFNCVDRHLTGQPDSKALIWQGEREEEKRSLTYRQLYEEVCSFARVLLDQGVRKGDRVCIYLPMIPELVIAVLACARLGAVHSVVFAGFSAESLARRIEDASCGMLITSNAGIRGGKSLPLKQIADQALEGCQTIESVLVIQRNNESCRMKPGRDFWYHKLKKPPSEIAPETMRAEDPLFILYTSGSTGVPKGVVHTQGGYLLYASLTHRYIFDLQPDDIYWCTADIGWITGHSYVVYGPLANGATVFLYEGTPTFPDPGRFWQLIERYGITKFYTAPTVIRSLIAQGSKWPEGYDLSSLRLLGTVGEPINPESWIWYYKTIGKKRLPVVDTWWQTETGGILISPLPGCHTLKPGSVSRPFFGIDPLILREDGTECGVDEGGALCIRKPWPGMMRTTWGNHRHFIETYFKKYGNSYFTGDGCRRDQEGDYWLLGRMDDVVNISGHRLGTAEIESALVSHPSVAQAAVVAVPHEIKGQALYAFVSLVEPALPTEELAKELSSHIRKSIGPIAEPQEFQFTKALPVTRSGKIMRRILQKIAEGDVAHLGDTSTLADPQVIEELLAERL